ncbi:hypothetical protein ACIRL3_25445 [Streptomyces sp. NPDC102384]
MQTRIESGSQCGRLSMAVDQLDTEYCYGREGHLGWCAWELD